MWPRSFGFVGTSLGLCDNGVQAVIGLRLLPCLRRSDQCDGPTAIQL